MRTPSSKHFLWALACLFFSTPAQALRVYQPRPVLCAQSDVVVIAEVTGITSRWSEGELGGLERIVDVSVHRVLRGPPTEGLSLLLPGGQLGALHEWVEDVAVLHEDARYLLLLTKGPQGFTVTGGADGAIALPWGTSEADAIASLGGCL